MQCSIDITEVGKGHQTLVYETEDKQKVQDVVTELTKKFTTHVIYGQLGNETVQIQKEQIPDFVESTYYTKKVLVEILGAA